MSVDVIEGLVAMLRAGDNRIDSRIRLQKQVYLLQQLGFANFASLRFSYHHFGPYSRELSSDLHNAVIDGLLEETYEEFDREHTRYSYKLTAMADEYFPDPLPEEWRRVVDVLRAHHWRVLELAATALYLQRHRKLEREAALARALELKPPCREYAEAARHVLAELARWQVKARGYQP